jgi:hypothetical protein
MDENTRSDHRSASQLAESCGPWLPVHAKPGGVQGCNWLPGGLDEPLLAPFDPPPLHGGRVSFRFGEPRKRIAAWLVACVPVVLTLEDGHGWCIRVEHLRVV